MRKTEIHIGARNYAEAQWEQLMKQAAYAFNMPHSYAYSLMGYVQAYLKTYYPVEFWTAALNTIDRGLEKHNESSLGKYINSISKSDLTFEKPDINNSGVMFESKDKSIYFALSYIKDVSKGAEDIIKLRPFADWLDFLKKSTEGKINKRVIRALIFSGAVDFGADLNERPKKWLEYLNLKKKGKKGAEEIAEYEAHMPESHDVIKLEYDFCKYSFAGIDAYIRKNATKATLRNNLNLVKTISQRDKAKKLWVLLGYIEDISLKTSKKSGNEYVLLTLTDFRETISVYGFGADFKNQILGKFKKGQLVKVGIKNESAWLKLPWPSEYNNKFPVEVVG